MQTRSPYLPFATRPAGLDGPTEGPKGYVSEVTFLVLGRTWGAYLGDPPQSAGTYVLKVWHEEPVPTRDELEHALCLNSGDFASITDFRASWRQGDDECPHCHHVAGVYGESPWQADESEPTFQDCLYGDSDVD